MQPKIPMRWLGAALLLLCAARPVRAQDEAAQRLEALERKVAELSEALARLGESAEEREAELAELRDELDSALQEAEATRAALATAEFAGTSRVLVAGDAFVTYADDSAGNGSTTVGFDPHFYWRVGEHVLFGTGVEFELGDGETEVNCEWAQAFFDVGPRVTLGVGKFLMPFGYFQENIHSPYIDKLPLEPLALDEGALTALAPPHDLGLQIRGPLELAALRFDYTLYVSNGPELDLGDDDPRTAGSLDYENFQDSNTNKAIGGRLGFHPWPELELGYSALVARVGPDGTPFDDVDAVLQDVDLNYVDDLHWLRGHLDARAEWAWNDVDPADFGAGPQDNDRAGGYAQLAYRPSELSAGFLGDLELVLRYDEVDQPSDSALADQTGRTIGLNHWSGPTSVFKVAYQDRSGDEHAFLLQYAIGF